MSSDNEQDEALKALVEQALTSEEREKIARSVAVLGQPGARHSSIPYPPDTNGRSR